MPRRTFPPTRYSRGAVEVVPFWGLIVVPEEHGPPVEPAPAEVGPDEFVPGVPIDAVELVLGVPVLEPTVAPLVLPTEAPLQPTLLEGLIELPVELVVPVVPIVPIEPELAPVDPVGPVVVRGVVAAAPVVLPAAVELPGVTAVLVP